MITDPVLLRFWRQVVSVTEDRDGLICKLECDHQRRIVPTNGVEPAVTRLLKARLPCTSCLRAEREAGVAGQPAA